MSTESGWFRAVLMVSIFKLTSLLNRAVFNFLAFIGAGKRAAFQSCHERSLVQKLPFRYGWERLGYWRFTEVDFFHHLFFQAGFLLLTKLTTKLINAIL